MAMTGLYSTMAEHGPLGMTASLFSQQQNASYNLSMQGIGDVAIDGPRLDFFESRKDF